MNEKEALAILDLENPSKDEIMDAYETACFKIIQQFYKDPVIPKLIDSRISKLETFFTALKILLPDLEFEKKQALVIDDLMQLENWVDFFTFYEINKANIRKALATTYNFGKLKEILQALKQNEDSYSNKIRSLGLNFSEEAPKLTDQVPVIDILAELNMLLEQGVIDKSFGSLTALNNQNGTFKLNKEFTRLSKLNSNE